MFVEVGVGTAVRGLLVGVFTRFIDGIGVPTTDSFGDGTTSIDGSKPERA